ncbi:uncharacterized protein LOC109836046 [Asparagus officinalis]|nr:uncharacterized protein LOC109836046 [Asparagus officinalis]
MNEYSLPDNSSSIPPPKEDIVLCKIYRKATSLKELEQRAAMEEDARAALLLGISSTACTTDTVSSSEFDCNFQNSHTSFDVDGNNNDELTLVKEEEEIKRGAETSSSTINSSLVARSVYLPELQVPRTGMEWQDTFLTQLRSPWLEQWSPLANWLNF